MKFGILCLLEMNPDYKTIKKGICYNNKQIIFLAYEILRLRRLQPRRKEWPLGIQFRC